MLILLVLKLGPGMCLRPQTKTSHARTAAGALRAERLRPGEAGGVRATAGFPKVNLETMGPASGRLELPKGILKKA